MKTSQQWYEHYRQNLQVLRIDWSLQPAITKKERESILASLQAWQLGETSEGKNLLHASRLYAAGIGDSYYPKAVELFIREEQKHGNNLGKYLDAIGEPRIKKDWGDSLFRRIRYFNASMELWTLAVITVESTAQIFYQSLKDATGCRLLQQICTDILIDEAAHIDFQRERFVIIFKNKNAFSRFFSYYFYRLFFFSTILVVWFAHKKAFRAGGNDFGKYWKKMKHKFQKTIGKLPGSIVSPDPSKHDTTTHNDAVPFTGAADAQNCTAIHSHVQEEKTIRLNDGAAA
jgi:hypothetical protein